MFWIVGSNETVGLTELLTATNYSYKQTEMRENVILWKKYANLKVNRSRYL